MLRNVFKTHTNSIRTALKQGKKSDSETLNRGVNIILLLFLQIYTLESSNDC